MTDHMTLHRSLALHARRHLARRLARKTLSVRIPAPLISFTFDDFPRSAAMIAGAMLNSLGLRGTYYAALGLLGKETEVGAICTAGDLEMLLVQGHEVACHTMDHLRCSDITIAELTRNCAENRRRALDILGYRLRNFAFPEGAVTLSAKKALSPQYETCRTIEPGINRDPLDLAFLRANCVYSRRSMTAVRQAIRENSRRPGWLILYTHDVNSNPSRYGCSPEDFAQVLKYAVASQATILPVSDALKLLQCLAPGRQEREE